MSEPASPVTVDTVRRAATDAPRWLRRLLTPLLARVIARQMLAQDRHVPVAELVRRVRADGAGEQDPEARALLSRVERNLSAAMPATDAGGRSRIPSAVVLVLANMVPLYGVLMLDWPVYPLIVLFWVENLVIGVVNVLKMLTVDPADPALWLAKLMLVPFFCVHYGAFAAGHGLFVFTLFGGSDDLSAAGGMFPVGEWIERVAALGLLLPAAVLAASHLFSFAWNHLLRGEFRIASVPELMTQPYRRVVVLHVVIIAGGMAVMLFGSPLWALLLLIGLKVNLDLRAHLREHRRPAVDETT